MDDYNMEIGKAVIILDEYMKKHNISRNHLVRVAQLKYTQLKRICDNQVVGIDLITIARICHALDCSVSDIIKYLPPKEK